MAENENQPAQDPRMKQALVCTRGDEEKARQMIDGSYKDAFVLKSKFEIAEADLHCNVMAFANAESGDFLNISIIIYNDEVIYASADPKAGWKDYYRACERIAKTAEISDSSDFLPHLKESLTGYDLISDMKAGDAEGAASKIIDIVEKFYSLKNIECSVDIEKVSTLELSEERIAVCVPGQESKEAAQAAQAEDSRPEIEQKTQIIVEGKLIVSPLHGKLVHNLNKGDRVMVMLVNRDGASLKIAEAIGAFDEDRNYKPVKARLVEMIPVEKVGYWLYASVAKNAVIKIVEEGNVQVEVPLDGAVSAASAGLEQKESADRNIVMYVALLIGLIAIAGLLIYAIL